MKPGDYVLATRWSDGNPREPFYIGFLLNTYKTSGQTRYLLCNKDGTAPKGMTNGFRRCEKISEETGALLVKAIPIFEQGATARSLWYWKRNPGKLKKLIEEFGVSP